MSSRRTLLCTAIRFAAAATVLTVVFLQAAPVLRWLAVPSCHCPAHLHAGGESAHHESQFSPCGDEGESATATHWFAALETPRLAPAQVSTIATEIIPHPRSRTLRPEIEPPRHG